MTIDLGVAAPSREASVDRPDSPRVRVATYVESLALALVIWPGSMALAATVGFALSMRLGSWVLVAALLGTAVPLALRFGRWRPVMVTLGVVVAIHLIAGTVAAAIPDGSWDGLTYQQEGVLRLAAGWNPLFEPAGRYGLADPFFNDHYPKLSWINAAVVLLTTGTIEAGKLFNVTLLIAAGAQVAAMLLLLTSFPGVAVLIVAGLAAFSPIAMSQLWTFYVDGALGSSLTVLVAAFVMYLALGRRWALAAALAAALLAANLKFTGLVYAVMLVGFAIPATAICRGGRSAVNVAAAALLVGAVAVGVVGYAPYVRNLTEFGDVFYSVPRTDVAGVRPVNLNDRNRVERFLMSNLSPSSSTRAPDRIHLKFPFSVGRREARALYSADLEIGGFGPLFGASLILTVLGAFALVRTRATRRAGAIVFVIVAVLLTTMFVHGETWWARYVPQAWLLPLVMVVAGLTAPARSVARILAFGTMGVLTLDIAIVAANIGWDEFRYVRSNHATMLALSAAPQPVRVYFSVFPSLRQRLSEAGVTFQILGTPPEPPARRHDLPAPGHQAAWFD
jgi:hypothetical protein